MLLTGASALRDLSAKAFSGRAALSLSLLVCGCAHDWQIERSREQPNVDGAGGRAPGSSGAGGAESSEPPDSTCVIDLRDDFSGASLDAQWDPLLQGGATVAVSGGQLAVRLPRSFEGVSEGFIATATKYDLTGCQVFAQVAQLPASPGNQGFGYLRAAIDGANYVELFSDQQRIFAGAMLDGSGTAHRVLPYDPAKHVLWRLREAQGSTYWETSVDGTSWEELASVPNPIPLQAVTVRIGAGVPPIGVEGEAHFDNVNVAP